MIAMNLRKTICVAVAVALTGCATVSPQLKPNVSAPAAWNEAGAPSGASVSADWWTTFGSAELHQLVSEALAGSPDLAIATERVRQAEAQVRVAGASLFPTLDLGAGTSSRQASDSRGSTTTNASSATLSASYELDLWGKNRAGVRSAESSLRATAYDRDAAQLTLLAGVATSYFQVLSLRSRLAVARENLAIAERVRDLVSARVRNGAASSLDLNRQEATVLSSRRLRSPMSCSIGISWAGIATRSEYSLLLPDRHRARLAEFRPELDLVVSDRFRVGARAVGDWGTDRNTDNDFELRQLPLPRGGARPVLRRRQAGPLQPESGQLRDAARGVGDALGPLTSRMLRGAASPGRSASGEIRRSRSRGGTARRAQTEG